MATKKFVLVVVGFLITLGSTVLNSYVVRYSNAQTMDLTKDISSLTQARDTAQVHIIESGTKGDSASILYALYRTAPTDGIEGHLLIYSRKAIEAALRFKCAAISALEGALQRQSPSSTCAAKPEKELLDGLFNAPKGDPEMLKQLLQRDENDREKWQTLDGEIENKIRGLAKDLGDAEARASQLHSVLTGLGLLGLMIVLARDLVG